jgi:hypothetical protein
MSGKLKSIRSSLSVRNIAVADRVLDRNDQRSAQRFPLTLRVRYRIHNEWLGSIDQAGKSLDISSNGLFIASEQPSHLGTGTEIVAVVEWPVLRDSSTPIQLLVSGWVVRSDRRGFAIAFSNHELRTIESGDRQITPDPLAMLARESHRRTTRVFARPLPNAVHSG